MRIFLKEIILILEKVYDLTFVIIEKVCIFLVFIIEKVYSRDNIKMSKSKHGNTLHSSPSPRKPR